MDSAAFDFIPSIPRRGLEVMRELRATIIAASEAHGGVTWGSNEPRSCGMPWKGMPGAGWPD